MRRSLQGETSLRAVRRVLRGRQNRADAGEVSYRLYMAVMVIIVVVAPVARIGVLGFADTYAGGDLALIASGLTAVTALLVLGGAQGGPAYAGLAPLDLLYTTAIPRRRLLARSVARGLVAGAVVGAFACGLVIIARSVRGDMAVELAVESLLVGVAMGLLAAFGTLLGQLGRGIRWSLASALALLAVAQLMWGFQADPWSLGVSAVFAELDTAGEVTGVPALLPTTVVLLAAALLLACAGPRIAALLSWEALREQAARWDVIHVTAGTGDPKAALDRLGAPVRVGRRWRFRPSRALALAILGRDLLGMLRTPARSLLGLIGLGLGLGVWWCALGVDVLGAGVGSVAPVQSGVFGAAAMLLVTFALRPWCRGLATAAEGAGSSPLLPVSSQGLLARHLLAPLGLATAVVGAGIVALIVLGSASGTELWGVACSSLVLVCCGLALRLLAALKGSIPLRLLAPIPTPMGDASGINVALWMIDGPVLSLLSGALLGVLWAVGLVSGGVLVWAWIVSAAVLGSMLLWARGRLKG